MGLDRLDDLYRDAILDHRRNPRNRKALKSPDIVGGAINPFCGDEIHLQIGLDRDKRIARIGLQGEGCSINLAAGSMLTEVIEGKALDEAASLVLLFRRMMQGDAEAEAQLRAEGDLHNLAAVREFPVRIKCALLSWSALADGIQDYRSASGV